MQCIVINHERLKKGDIWDKGGADLYVLRQLLSLHRRYPNRVHFLMGNRDINKMRVVDELGTGTMDDQNDLMPTHRGVYWLRGTVCSGLQSDPADNIPSQESAAERLKWMLQKTMGSVDAFELRRSELLRERTAIVNDTAVSPSQLEQSNDDGTVAVNNVTDDEVTQSYIRSCNPISGIMGQYLANAKLVIRFGPVVFLHGALPVVPGSTVEDEPPALPIPWIPSISDDDTTTDHNTLTNWIDILNDFAKKQVGGWKEYCSDNPPQNALDDNWATEGGYCNNTRSGKMFGKLMQYGMGTLPDRSKTQSCVYNSWMHDGLPRDDMFGSDDSRKSMSKLFRREGIQIILTGHQPVGDAPWPIQISESGEKTKLWIIPCDTSFSGDTRSATLKGFACTNQSQRSLGRGTVISGRGEVAISEPVIRFCPATGTMESVKISGCLSNGSFYETGNIISATFEDNLFPGRKLGHVEFEDKKSGETKEGTFWVKGKVGRKDHLVSYGKGFNVWNSFV